MSFQNVFNCLDGNIQALDIRDEFLKSSHVSAVAWLPPHFIDQICESVSRKFHHLDKLTNSVIGNSRRYSRPLYVIERNVGEDGYAWVNDIGRIDSSPIPTSRTATPLFASAKAKKPTAVTVSKKLGALVSRPSFTSL
jgi:hypothetical protein